MHGIGGWVGDIAWRFNTQTYSIMGWLPLANKSLLKCAGIEGIVLSRIKTDECISKQTTSGNKNTNSKKDSS